MRDGFRLDEREWRDRAIELMRRMNSETLGLVDHERVIGNEEKTSDAGFDRVINTRKAPTANASYALGYDRKRNLLVGVHRRTQSREIDSDRIDRLRLDRDSISRPRAYLVRSSKTRRVSLGG